MAVPQLHSTTIDIFSVSHETKLELPIISAGISAGFPSPALDFIDVSIDLNKFLIKNPFATFYGRVKGQSMKDVGIFDGDLLVIDKSLEASDNKIAVCYINGGFTIKRIKIENNCCWLIPANDEYAPMKVTDQDDFQIWGIVTYIIKAI